MKKIKIFDYIYELDEDNDYYNENEDSFEDEAYVWKNLNEEVEILEENILDDKEKEYLSAVIKPFRDRVKYIKKKEFADSGNEYIEMNIITRDYLADSYTRMAFPDFKTNTMYKCMEQYKEYTVEELGL